MEDQGDVRRDIYPHASIAQTASENVEMARQKLSEEKAKINESVASREYKDLSHEAFEDYREVISAAKQGIKDLYSQAGVEIRDEDFAELHLLRPQESRDQRQSKGRYISDIHSLYISADRGPDFFENAVAIYHELFHSVGRHAEIAVEGGNFFEGQSGYATRTREGVLKKVMGKVLEEGTATYYANKWALESDSETLVKARRNYAWHMESNRQLSTEDKNKIVGMSQSEKEDYICRSKLTEKQPPEYNGAERMIGVLIQGAARAGADQYGGSHLEASLLRSRVLSQNRGDLMQIIDSTFGSGTTREIFHLPFDGAPTQINRVVQKMESQVYN